MRPASSNSLYAIGTDDWFGIVNMRIQRPSSRNVLTTLNDCEPPHTCITASVRPWLGRTAPCSSGIQSIWFFITAVMAPCRSGLHHTWPSDHRHSSRSSTTFGCVSGTLPTIGSSVGSKIFTSAPKCSRIRAAS
jgi:hypothetical protein